MNCSTAIYKLAFDTAASEANETGETALGVDRGGMCGGRPYVPDVAAAAVDIRITNGEQEAGRVMCLYTMWSDIRYQVRKQRTEE